ncbi:MAG: hypothetical protein LBN21_04120 [Treponema sp.]|jgi:hypothetical protein|nr:hypothetical protein [Treponema sp.]
MREIWISELVVVFFLFISLVRPFFKGLWRLEGLTWLPFLAFALTVALFPAYGFRPECIPLLIFGFLLNLVNIPAMMSSVFSRPNDDFRDRSLVFTVPALALLAASAIIAFIYAPLVPTGLSAAAVKTVKLHNEAQNTGYSLRIYEPVPVENLPPVGSDLRPLLLVIPPDSGQISAVDRICAGLRDRGFTVISYSRKGAFSAYRSWRVFRAAHKTNKANEWGRVLETARREDLEYLLPQIRQNRDNSGAPLVSGGSALVTGTDSLIIAGYGAGGSAAVYLADSPDFAGRYGYVKGVIAVESGFYSSYRPGERKKTPLPESAKWFTRFMAAAAGWFGSFVPLKVDGINRLPSPAVPVLYLNASEGAGPLDFTDYPATHPVYHVLFPSREKLRQNKNRLSGTERIADTVDRFTIMVTDTLSE